MSPTILNIIYLIDCKHTPINEKASLNIVFYLVIAKLPINDTSDKAILNIHYLTEGKSLSVLRQFLTLYII